MTNNDLPYITLDEMKSNLKEYQREHPWRIRWNSFIYELYRFTPDQLYHNCKYAYQRMSRGFSDRDCWSADQYLGHVIPDMLEKLREWRTGTPMRPGATDIDDYHTEEEYWDSIVPFIIHGIRQHERLIHELEYWSIPQEDKDAIEEDWQEAMRLFVVYYSSFWD